jgi:hypothetical protein
MSSVRLLSPPRLLSESRNACLEYFQISWHILIESVEFVKVFRRRGTYRRKTWESQNFMDSLKNEKLTSIALYKLLKINESNTTFLNGTLSNSSISSKI